MQPTALVHEAWLRLVGAENQAFEGREHFFAAAAEAMRRILIERARHRMSLLAEALAGRRLREDGVPESLPVERWKTLSASLGSLAGEDFYARWTRWFLTERLQDKPVLFEP